ncbi:MAG: PDDEXK nuclease domain-containing protein [Leptolyngbyaceae cyanobacterium MO_188.B28]|nr:PDDEXK nuclease domain-containing protein [Leptolyngbyaceae cyanobacterium MO_188.B28]
MPRQTSLFPEEHYNTFLSDLKSRIRRSQVLAATALNKEVILLYWQIGGEILKRQKQQGWGSKVIDRLAKDLKQEFPDISGFSPRNLKYMRSFAEAYPDQEIVQQLLHKVPWGHHVRLLDSVKDPQQRLWYIHQTIENGWSRNVLILQIDSGLYQRQGEAITNFETTLPSPQSDLAQQLIKDPYNFDFLTISKDAQERELERGLIEHIRDFLLELGVGFSFMGSQYPLEIDGKEYRLDLLFYHARLHSYVVLDLKMGEFEPAFSGQMNFYISAVNHTLCTEGDNPTIGIILCRSKSKTTVEFALDTLRNPIGVSTYRLGEKLPPQYQKGLPTAEQLEMELEIAIQEIGEWDTEAPGTSG